MQETSEHLVALPSHKMQDIYTERSGADRRAVGVALRQRILRFAQNKKKKVDFNVWLFFFSMTSKIWTGAIEWRIGGWEDKQCWPCNIA